MLRLIILCTLNFRLYSEYFGVYFYDFFQTNLIREFVGNQNGHDISEYIIT